MKKDFKKRWYLFAPLFLAGAALFGFITMWLWNSLLPLLFHFPEISFWQAIGLLILTRLLFGSFGGGHHRHYNNGWRGNMREKWHNMSQEERENFMKNHNISRDWCRNKDKSENKE